MWYTLLSEKFVQGKFPAVKEVGYESTHCTQPERRGAAGAGVESLGGGPGHSGGDGTGLWNETAARLACRRGQDRAQLLGEVETKAARTLVLEPGAYPPALVLANFKEKDVDTLLDLMKQAKVNIPLKAIVTPSNKNWVCGDLLAHLQEEHTAFTAAAKEQA